MFGRSVRDHRLRLGMSQAEVADRAGLSERSLRNIEADRVGKPRPATVRRLADSFGLSGDERETFIASAFAEQPPGPAQETARPAADRPTTAGTPAAGAAAGSAGPAQLPAGIAHFTGRADSLTELADLLARPGVATSVVVISGTAGVGKTTLGVHWAHQAGDRFPDGQLYVNLRGYDPDDRALSPGDALARFLTALGVTAVPADLDARAALFRSRLAGRRVLLLLDNARDAEHVRPLLPGAPGCLTLVTSRDPLTSLVAVEGAYPVPLDVLTDDEAHRLLATRLGARRVAAEPAVAAEIVQRCARLPLALSIVAALAATRPREPLGTLAAELAGGLDALDAGDAVSNVRGVFSWSVRTLSPAARHLFPLLGVHPGADADVYAAAALAGRDIAATRAALAELTDAALLTEHRPGRWTFHDLLREYAAGLAAPAEAGAALGRLLDHYLHTAAAAMQLLYPAEKGRRPQVDDPGLPAPPLPDADVARDVLTAERANLVAATAFAADGDRPGHAVKLARTLFRFLEAGGHYADALVVHDHARRAAERIGDDAALAGALNDLGQSSLWMERFDEARSHYGRALELYARLGDESGQGLLHNSLGGLHMFSGDGPGAVREFEQATVLLRRTDLSITLIAATNNLASAYEMVGDYAAAVDTSRQGIALSRTAGFPRFEATAHNNLGGVLRRLGRYDESVAELLAAMELHRGLGNLRGEIDYVRQQLGRSYRLAGRLREAADLTHQALDGARQSRDRRVEAYALVNLGLVTAARGDHVRSVELARQAVEAFAAIGDRGNVAQARNALGAVLAAAGRTAEARAEHAAALAVAEQVGERYEQAHAHDGLAHAAHALGDPDAAREHWTAALDLAADMRIPLEAQARSNLAALAAGRAPTRV